MNKHRFNINEKGFSVIEVILAAALFIIFSTGAIVVILQGLDSNRLGEEQTVANQYAAEGIEAARSIRNSSYASLVNTSGTGIASSSGVWVFLGSNNVFGKYTRALKVEDVQRTGGNIVASGGTIDPNTKKITSTVTWNFSSTRNNSVVLTTYLTNWRKTVKGSSPSLIACFNLDVANSGSEAADGISVATQGNYLYLGRQNNSGYEFFVFDITTPSSPSLLGKLAIGDTANDIAVSGNYAYIASSDNAGELTVIDISNPASPTIATKFDLTAGNSGNGNSDGLAVAISGNTLYLTRAASAGKEFYVFNISTPTAPTLTGSVDLNGDLKEIAVMGSYVYGASSDNTQEFQVINIATPSSPVLTTSLDLNEGATQPDALSITTSPNTVYLGRDGSAAPEFYIIDVTTPGSPTIKSTLDIGTHILQSMDYDPTTKFVFFANTAPGSEDYQVVDVNDPLNPVLLNNFNLNGTPYKVVYSSTKDAVMIASGYDSCELQIISP